jgi:flavin-binding protein dodecin
MWGLLNIVIEIVGTSEEDWSGAAQVDIGRAGSNLSDLRVEDGKIRVYARINVSSKYEDK